MIIFFVIIAVLILSGVAMYNSLIGKRNQVDNAFGTIDVMLKKRYDLIPNLVETVKQYMTFEKDTLTRIVELRNTMVNQPDMPAQQRMNAENEITKLLSGIRVAVENYPDLKSNQSFMQLQRTWNEVEGQISAARRTYNAAITSYNNSVEMIPSNIIAGWMGYETMEVLTIAESERHNVHAKDLFK